MPKVCQKVCQNIVYKNCRKIRWDSSNITYLLPHRQLLHVGRLNLYLSFKIDFEQAKAYRKSTDQYLRANQWEDITVEVFI